MADDLRDRIAETLRATWDGAPTVMGDAIRIETDAVLTVVGPELERRELAVETLIDQRESLRHRAVTAEAEVERLRAEVAMHEYAAPATNELAKLQRERAEQAEAGRDALKAELKNMTLARNAADAMKGVHKRRADLLRAELLNAKAALAGDNEGIGRFMADCDQRAKRSREQMAVWQQAAEQAEAAIERARAKHQPIRHGGITICAHCSGWNGTRCRGEIRPHPCPTLAVLDTPAPTEEGV